MPAQAGRTVPGDGGASANAGRSAAALPVAHPAHPLRCHLEDGPAISPARWG